MLGRPDGMDDTPEGTCADIVQVLLVLLFIHPDAREICVPRDWISQWYRDLGMVLDYLRQHPTS